MKRRNWTRDELIIAFNLYCKIPFSKINYKHKKIVELADFIGRTPSAVSWKLVNFASLDPSLKERGIAGASNSGKLDKEIFNEFNSNWENLILESENLYSKIFKEENLIDFDDKQTFDIKEGKERHSLVKVRVNQSFFRQSVLASYDFKCCITGIEISELLVASHIIPWSKDEKNRMNPENGLCLNSFHDKAFDKGLLAINEDFKIIISKNIKKNQNSHLNQFLFDFENKSINLPSRFLPNKEFLKYHYENIFIK